ncbi:MAG: ABC transporter ATP-binding protein/permease [Leptospirales bacterium]|jgi:ABC-type transport system involved in Fe-S cluster assembly fused permease/ATPase subunit
MSPPRTSPRFNAADSSRRSHWGTLATLGRYLWPRGRLDLRIRVVLAVLALILAKVVNVVVPYLYKLAVDALTGETGAKPVTEAASGAADETLLIIVPITIILAYGGARVLSQAFGELRDLIFIKVGQHSQRSIALDTFRHLHGLSLGFHLERQTGGLSRVIERGVRGISFVLSFMLFNILPTLLEIFLVIGVLLYAYYETSPAFAVITFGTIFLYIVFTLVITDWRLKYRRNMNQNDTEANTKAIDSLINYETVKYFGNEEHEYARYDRALAGYEQAAVKSQGSLTVLNLSQGLTIGAGLVAVMYLAAEGVAAGELTVGDFVLINTYLIQLYLPLNFLGFVYREVKQSLTDMDKMFELLEVGADVRDEAGAVVLNAGPGKVEFRNVSFAYKPDRSIIDNLSFTVPPGRTTAIVGPSGAGKSTISRLLFRFYDVDAGGILIDGQDLREVSQKSLRAAIGVVPQDTVLFNDTIGYNIAYGRPGAEKSAVQEAARLARIDRFVSDLPEGYETTVGERGMKVSGGEKQRIAIARAILKSPRIMLFDEATSALDSHTEKEIQASLREVSKDRTTLVIAHRLSTIVDADEILVLKQGRLVERGKHSELLRKGGEYAEMWRKQQEAEELREKVQEIQAG